MIKTIEKQVITGPIGSLATILTNSSMRMIESDEDSVALSVRMPPGIKQRIEQYAKAGNTSQNIIARMLIEAGLDQLDEAILFLNQEKEDEMDAMQELIEEEERKKKLRQSEALKALKSLRVK